MSIAIQHIKFIGILVIFLQSGMVNAETGKAPDPGAVLKGKALYEKHCISCHQKDGVGEKQIPLGIRHPEFFPAMPLNDTSHAWHHSDEQLSKTILEGIKQRKRMPAFKNVLSRKETLDLVAYIKSLWSPKFLACQGPKHMSCMH